MKYRKLSLGLAVAASLVLPMSIAGPAFAEGGTGDYGIAEQPVDESVFAGGQQLDDEAGVIAANRALDEAAATAAAAAPVAGAVTGVFGNIRIAAAASLTTPSITATSSAPKVRSIKVAFDGPATSSSMYYYMTYANYSGPKVSNYKRNHGVTASYVNKPYLYFEGSGGLTPAATNVAAFKAYSTTTPGKYKITVPITQRNYGTSPATVKTLTKSSYVTVKANPKTSKATTRLSGSARAKHTFPVTVTAPNYQSGAKVKVYYKAKGTKTYKKVGDTLRLKAQKSSYSKATIKVPAKYNVSGRGGYIKVKVGSVTFAPGYTSSTAKLTRQ